MQKLLVVLEFWVLAGISMAPSLIRVQVFPVGLLYSLSILGIVKSQKTR